MKYYLQNACYRALLALAILLYRRGATRRRFIVVTASLGVSMKVLSSIGRGLAVVLGVVCLPLMVAAQPSHTNASPVSTSVAGEKLVDAIILVESHGDAKRIGRLGERGLMQIRLATWRETTREIFGLPQPFQQAFDPALNRRVGRAYLAHLQTQIEQHRADWQSDERSLLIAAYNAGPTLLAQKRYALDQMPAATRDYVERVINLHEAMLAELIRTEQQNQAARRGAQHVASVTQALSQ
ncbi:MAG: lytic transglycosylase domain-containing protein [Kiritimatiellaeota bacterium]|nr:lytic transglycosylase domain-containing protein [Kiritimatiellota bacterium]